ncbi:hypothetical protein PCG10_009075 [Penicillium crustosum]|uniref:DUF7702 domain-containing protein n=1 Tax=Penicillium crustosum TaxID=36656 RepID=A0A9P5GE01_PENCR|nr:uncharacterized protein N7487_005815 [Penicillium crustosum]KAF7520585.1 hypothetical protein PCG10_009075 [Penicillium crustosum]KAJ5411456.1 hypothetical protein N7487_005815 [Penicillium crustosum]
MAVVGYRNGIAILQLIVFPIILVAAIFIWKRTGWREGSKIWRYAVTLSLIRIAGSISSLLTISNDSHNIKVAVAVCQLIGIAPLLLTFIGLLRQIDVEKRMPPRPMALLTLVTFVALILGIAGVHSSSGNDGTYRPSKLAKVAMGIFLAVFVIFVLLSVWLFYELSFSLRRFQKKLFLAIALSIPLLVVRLVYSALSDYTTLSSFALNGNTTVYLCMDVLEEIIAMGITMALGISAILEKDFVKLTPVPQEDTEPKSMGA